MCAMIGQFSGSYFTVRPTHFKGAITPSRNTRSVT